MSGSPQIDLFGPEAPILPPISRNSDPQTSHAAGRDHTRSGKRGTNCELVETVVRREPGLTYREIHAHIPTIREAVEVQRRCSDLERIGRIVSGEPRTCTRSGRPAQTWWPVERGA
jgi:hypothetical protein